MKKHFLIFTTLILLTSCGGNTNNNNNTNSNNATTTENTTPQATTTVATSENPDWQNNKGIGPVKTIKPPLATPPDTAMATKGEETFSQYCMSCHLPKRRLTGPAMLGIMERRTPEWVMNMILNPEEMEAKDPIAKKMVEESGFRMLDQRLNEQQAREVLEYLRTIK